ncbi:hypothetical protein BJ085DRAFT_30029 [Dimargaris cristalligena]|uniref:Uncharacterized protein n=1 Tax=Dimargaris cristalligena TaxID=215637 RepID=A0A4P9ZY15_9FUNG|nr:hypothetical protein BJ085DRAFT_30029 [Dimargaris cristalligena]|eukprot:RKP37812.1 hypothetical protein BJ085DRAFT_30029 [Dimargaris cristalligena]
MKAIVSVAAILVLFTNCLVATDTLQRQTLGKRTQEIPNEIISKVGDFLGPGDWLMAMLSIHGSVKNKPKELVTTKLNGFLDETGKLLAGSTLDPEAVRGWARGNPASPLHSISPALSSVVVQFANAKTLQLLSTIYIRATNYRGKPSLFEDWLDQVGAESGLSMAPMKAFYYDPQLAVSVIAGLSIHLAIVHLYQTQQYSAISQYLQLTDIATPRLSWMNSDSDLRYHRLQSTYFFLTLAILDENGEQVLGLVQALRGSLINLSFGCYRKFLANSELSKQKKYLVNLVNDKNVWLKSDDVTCHRFQMGSYWFRLSSRGELGVVLNVPRFAPNLAKEAFMKSNPANHYPIETLAKFEPKQSLWEKISKPFTQ